jgi:hypothetical protein
MPAWTASQGDAWQAYTTEKQDSTTGGTVIPAASFTRSVVWFASYPVNAADNNEWIAGANCRSCGYADGQLEFDGFEMDGHQVPFPSGGYASVFQPPGGVVNWIGTYPPHFQGYDSTSGYHTIDQRITHDGTTVYKCMWIDEIFQNCVSAAPGSTHLANNARQNYVYIQIGCNCASGSLSIPQHDVYIKQVQIWDCPSWQTTNCATSNPDPGNY